MTADSQLARFSAVLGFITLGCLVAALLLSRLGKRSAWSQVEGNAGAQRPAGYYREFLRLCQKRRIVIKSHDTLRQILRKFSEAPPFAALLLRYHYQTRYGSSAPDPATEAKLREQIRSSE